MLQLFEMRFRFTNPPRSKLSSKRVSSGSFIEFAKRLLKLTEKSSKYEVNKSNKSANRTNSNPTNLSNKSNLSNSNLT